MRKNRAAPIRPMAHLKKGHRRFHVMAKPGGAACNLDCAYCYYLHKKKLLGQSSSPVMDEVTLENFIRQYIEGVDSESVVFSWQGGEPTLLGLPFFENVLRLQKRHTPRGRTVANTLQTNGTLLTDDWAAFLKRHGFLVGLSVDGPEELHDIHRRDKAGRPTFRQTMAGHAHLRRHGVSFTVLTTVNRDNARKPLEVYRFLTRELGADYIQFNPCVEPADFRTAAPRFRPENGGSCGKNSPVAPWSVDPDDWGTFLCEVFDEWLTNDLGRVLVNYFETAVAQSMNLPAQICPTGEICGKGVAIEHDGGVYSCDHYVYPEYRLGVIDEHNLAEMVFSERQKNFGFKKRDTLPRHCLECPHGLLCWGQCPRHRLVDSPEGEPGLNYLCRGWKAFYAHAKPDIRKIAMQILGTA